MAAHAEPRIRAEKGQGRFGRDAGWKLALLFLIGAALLAAFVGLLFGVLSYSFHNSYVFNEAISRAERNPQVVSRIGTPLRPGWLPEGHIRISGDSGTAHMEIPVTGPRGKATIRLDASKASGTWHFSVLEIEFEGQTRWLDLLDSSESTGQSAP